MTKNKFIKKSACFLAILTLLVSIVNTAVYAQTNGVYLAPASAHYVNPETGIIVDGGSNEALGTSMCQAIVDVDALVEVADEKTYVTVGLGLDSNISSVQILVQTEAGKDEYTEAEAVETGRYEKDNDDCVQYRFEVYDAQFLISPVLFVEAMGRSVQFFIQLDMEQAQPGTGNYLSEMASAEPEAEEEAEAETEEEIQAEEQTEAEPEAETKRETVGKTEVSLADAKGLQVYEVKAAESEAKEDSSSIPVAGILGGAAVVVLLGAVLVMRSKKGGK